VLALLEPEAVVAGPAVALRTWSDGGKAHTRIVDGVMATARP
jgi:hypothetical protein